VVLVAVAAVTLGDGGLIARIQYRDPLVLRRDIYQSGIAMFAERPLTGFGLGTFSAAYPAYANFDNGRFVNLAHNDWLQLAVEGGLITLILFGAFCTLILRDFRRSIWALGVPIVLVHALVDFPMNRAGVAAWWMLLAGALSAKRLSRWAEPTPVPLSVESSDRFLATAPR
jgi:O-antigen ligase